MLDLHYSHLAKALIQSKCTAFMLPAMNPLPMPGVYDKWEQRMQCFICNIVNDSPHWLNPWDFSPAVSVWQGYYCLHGVDISVHRSGGAQGTSHSQQSSSQSPMYLSSSYLLLIASSDCTATSVSSPPTADKEPLIPVFLVAGFV